MIKWIKPSGVEIETNEKAENIAMAESLGWKRYEEKEEPTKRRGRPKKAE